MASSHTLRCCRRFYANVCTLPCYCAQGRRRPPLGRCGRVAAAPSAVRRCVSPLCVAAVYRHVSLLYVATCCCCVTSHQESTVIGCCPPIFSVPHHWHPCFYIPPVPSKTVGLKGSETNPYLRERILGGACFNEGGVRRQS